MVGHLCGLHHLNSLVLARIEGLPLRLNRLHSQPRQHVMKLAVNQLDSGAEVGDRLALRLYRAIQAVEDWQELFQGVGERVFAKLLLFAKVAFAEVFKFGLQPSQPIELKGVFRFQLLQLGGLYRIAGRVALRKLVLHIHRRVF